MSLDEMVREERLTTAEDHDEMLSRLSGKVRRLMMTSRDRREDFLAQATASTKVDDDWTVDDVMASRKRSRMQLERDDAKSRGRAVRQQQLRQQTLDSCRRCLDSGRVGHGGVVALGLKTYLAVPQHQPLVTQSLLLLCRLSSLATSGGGPAGDTSHEPR